MKQIIVDNQVTQYKISKTGQCFNINSKKYLKGQISNSGYLNFNLTLPSGEKRRFYAHRLVAVAYIDNPKNKPEVNHLDGNKLNNNVNNLEWVTASENQYHNTKINNKKTLKKVYQYNKNKELIKIFNGVGEAARELNISQSLISQEINKNKKTLTKGFYWADSENNNFSTIQYINSGKSKEVGQYNKETDELIKVFPSTGAAARFLGINSSSHIGECCRGKIKSYKGYKWKYINDDIV